MSCNKKCLWNYEGQCVSESLDTIYNDETFETDDYIGWLREDFEEHFVDTYNEIVELLNHRKCSELEEILEFVKKQIQ